jgi:site-specific DNA-cytosine methylase
MRLVELFAGTRSVSSAAEARGWETWSTDLYDFGGIDLQTDVLDLSVDDIPWTPDAVWASPPCTTFSVASIGHHWTGGKGAYIPKTKGALIGLALMHRTLEIIEACKPNVWFIENPRGLMRKMPEMEKLPIRHTVTYCQYGDTRMKPTDVWTNCTEWTPRAMCKNGDPCHEAAPRGARTGTQGLKGAHDRSKIPHALCMQMIEAAFLQVKMTP